MDRSKNSPYVVYQYFLNIADADVERFLKLFTFYDFDTIEQIIATHQQDLAQRYGQDKLAEYVVKLIFGDEEARQAQMISQILFSKDNPLDIIATMSAEDIGALQQETGGVQSAELRVQSDTIVNLLVQT
ncbi:hypothetical protein KAZ93_02505 [Patescibacteria group bacterium]|nr:hypothetical protein [Patescibacteria group bacterium]